MSDDDTKRMIHTLKVYKNRHAETDTPHLALLVHTCTHQHTITSGRSDHLHIAIGHKTICNDVTCKTASDFYHKYKYGNEDMAMGHNMDENAKNDEYNGSRPRQYDKDNGDAYGHRQYDKDNEEAYNNSRLRRYDKDNEQAYDGEPRQYDKDNEEAYNADPRQYDRENEEAYDGDPRQYEKENEEAYNAEPRQYDRENEEAYSNSRPRQYDKYDKYNKYDKEDKENDGNRDIKSDETGQNSSYEDDQPLADHPDTFSEAYNTSSEYIAGHSPAQPPDAPDPMPYHNYPIPDNSVYDSLYRKKGEYYVDYNKEMYKEVYKDIGHRDKMHKSKFTNMDDVNEQPLYVNAHQFNCIRKRKLRRDFLDSITRPKNTNGSGYLHESRHRHAMNRLRAPSGRFLTKEEAKEMRMKEKKT